MVGNDHYLRSTRPTEMAGYDHYLRWSRPTNDGEIYTWVVMTHFLWRAIWDNHLTPLLV